MIDTVRGVGYMAATPPQPEWILTEAPLTTVWTSAVPAQNILRTNDFRKL
jgi:hypothetical protein